MDIASQITANASQSITNHNRLNTLIDSGTALDTISELQAAWRRHRACNRDYVVNKQRHHGQGVNTYGIRDGRHGLAK